MISNRGSHCDQTKFQIQIHSLANSDILDSKSKLWKSKRFACWITHESMYTLIKQSDPRSELHRIMDGKRPPDNQLCELDSLLWNFDKLNKFDFTKAFFVMKKSALYIMLAYLERSLTAQNKLIFEKTLFGYHMLQVHYMAKSLDDQLKKMILKG